MIDSDLANGERRRKRSAGGRANESRIGEREALAIICFLVTMSSPAG
jgi:hypothetical protein